MVQQRIFIGFLSFFLALSAPALHAVGTTTFTSTVTPTVTPTLTWAPASLSVFNCPVSGRTLLDPPAYGGGQMVAVPVTLTASGDLQSLGTYVSGISGSQNLLHLALYADNGFQPGAYLGQTAIVPATLGWNAVPLGLAGLSPGMYWVVVHTQSDVRLTMGTGATPSYWYAPFAWGPFPTSLAGGTANSATLNAVMEVCAGPAGTATQTLTPTPYNGTATHTATPSFTGTFTTTVTKTITVTPVGTFTFNGTGTPTATSTFTSTRTATPTRTAYFGSMTATPTFSVSQTPTITLTPSAGSSTVTFTRTATNTSTVTNSPSFTRTTTAAITSVPTDTPVNGSVTATQTRTVTPTGTPYTPGGSSTQTRTVTPSASPTSSVTAVATNTPVNGSVTPSPTPVPQSIFSCPLSGYTQFVYSMGVTNSAIVVPVTLNNSGTLQDLGVYVVAVTGASSGIRMGLYADNGGVPGALLGQTLLLSAVPGWNALPLSLSGLSAGSYWVAVLTQSSVQLAMGAIPTAGYWHWNQPWAPLPTSWPSVVGLSVGPDVVMEVCSAPAPTSTPGGINTLPTPVVPGVQPGRSIVYPSPATGNSVTLGLNLPKSGRAHIVIMDVRGKVVIVLDQNFAAGPASVAINIAGLKRGIYLYRITYFYDDGSKGQSPLGHFSVKH